MSLGAMSQLFIAQSPLIIRCSYLKTSACQLRRLAKFSGTNRRLKSMEKFESDDRHREDQFHIGEDDDTEADFTQLHKAHYQFERETHLYNEKRDLKIAERKFFKTKKQPNLLTWEEKEQIRYLHNYDSEEWTVSNLSESFPASVEIIKKIIKAKWNMRDPDKIRKHNETVKKNWELLKEGKLEMNESLKKHVSKFTSRKRAMLPQPVCEPPNNMLPEGGEFGRIITEYQKKKSKTEEEVSKIIKTSSTSMPAPNNDTYVLYGNIVKDRRQVTLDTLRTNINQSISHGKKPSAIDLTILERVKPIERSDGQVGNLSEKPLSNSPDDKEKNAISSINESSAITLEHSMDTERDLIPFRIKIPKHCWVRGATYKVEDRYYDYDGTFLYRVPGMK